MDTYEVLEDVGLSVESDALREELIDGVGRSEWVHRNPYSLPEEDDLQLSGEGFADTVKHTERHRRQLVAPCRKYRVRRLDAFGSSVGVDFDEQSSNVDLLVQFEDLPHSEHADAYLGFLTAVEALIQRRVDLVEMGAVRNPYLRKGIDESRELVFSRDERR